MSDTRRALTRSLEAAAAAMSCCRYRTMAEHLRAAWRDSRDPTLAGMYELLLARVSSVPLAGRSPSERASSWRERAERGRGDPLELPILVAEPWHPDLPEVERLRLLARWTPDPLLAAAMARRLRLPLFPRWQPGANQVVVETIRLLASQRDPRQLPTLEQLAREPHLSSEQRRQLRGAIASIEVVPVLRLDASARAAMAPLEQRAREQRDREAKREALLQAVHADPDADAPRLVYADWLSGEGDPRGEFITLQLERHASKTPASARERELLERHVDEWSGVLHGVLGHEGRVFERGFLAAASIEAGRIEGELISAGEWATLRSLDGHVPEILALRGRLDRLRTLYGFLDLDRFLTLRAAGRLEAVEHYECSLADPNLRFDTPLGLRSLLVREALDERLIELLRSPACAGLEELAVYYDRGLSSEISWFGDHRERPHLRSRYELLREHMPRQLRRLRMLDKSTSRATRPRGCELSFERDASGALSLLRVDVHASGALGGGSDPVSAVIELVELLPLRSLSQLTLGEVDESCDRAALRAALSRTGVELVDAAADEQPGSLTGV